MINIYFSSWIHPKNMLALQKYTKIKLITDKTDIDKCQVIYLPSGVMDTTEYPDKLYIFGPHFSVFPNQHFYNIMNAKNAIYIQPSQWCKQVWVEMSGCSQDFIQVLPFGVDTETFNERQPTHDRKEVFVYFKNRDPRELFYLTEYLKKKDINFKLFSYDAKYDEQEYLNCLQNSKYGIVLDRHESQGFAIEEALSCNVPLLVWNVRSMNQEYGQNYPNIAATTIPYWDYRCGEFFYDAEDLEATFEKFVSKLHTYKPREYIMENLSIEKCEEKLLNLIHM